MKNRNSFVRVPHNIENEDVTTWALPKGAIARLGRGKNNPALKKKVTFFSFRCILLFQLT